MSEKRNSVPPEPGKRPQNQRYSDEDREKALLLYSQYGPTYVQIEMGIDKTTVSRWAKEKGVTTVAVAKTWAAAEAWEAKSAELRARSRYMAHEALVDLLARLYEPYVDFKGNAGSRRVFPQPPAEAVRNFVMSYAVLLDKIRLEEGKPTSRSEVSGNQTIDIRAYVDKAAREAGLDVDDVWSEVEAILTEAGQGES